MLTASQMDSLNKLKYKLDNFNKSISLLYENNFDQQGLILFLTLLDQLGWLSSDNDFSTGKDFKNWIDTYLDTSKLNCNSEDLWNLRCSLIHMDTSQSQRFNPEKQSQLAFYRNMKLSEKQRKLAENEHRSTTKYVDFESFVQEFHIGLDRFTLDLCHKKNLRDQVLKKIECTTVHLLSN